MSPVSSLSGKVPSVTPLVLVVAPRLRPGRVTGWPGAAEVLEVEYSDALRRAGAVPVALGVGGVGGPATPAAATPAAPAPDPGGYLGRFDGLLLVGGPDIDPALFGEEQHPEVKRIDRRRDELEIALCQAALAARLPILAICRGIQVLNVALAGTLHQHLPDLHLPVTHSAPGSDEYARHPVEVAPASRLAALVGATTVGATTVGATTVERCVSLHHQAVHDVAPGLVATAWSADGLIEGLETPAGGPWCVGVQWHPELSAETDPVQQGIFDGFVAETAR